MTYKLTYFNLTALGEPIRYMLHHCGIEFEDIRIEFEDWPKYKANMPMGQVPILEIDGKIYNQSRAIGRYLAKKYNLYGSDEFEAMEIDAAVDSIDDFRHVLATFYWQKDPVIKEKLKETTFEKMPFYLDEFEEQVKKNGGHFVRGKSSTTGCPFCYVQAHESVHNFVPLHEATCRNYMLMPHPACGCINLSWADFVFAAYSGYLSVIMATDMTKDRPELKKLVDKVNALPNIQAYLAKRPKSIA